MFTKALDRYVPQINGPYSAQIQADRLRMLYGALPIALLASLVNAAILGFVESRLVSTDVVILWVGAVALLTVWRFSGYLRFTRNPPSLPDNASWARRFLVEVFISGVLWGAAAVVLYPPTNAMYQMFLVFVLAGMGAGAVTTLSAMWSAALAYLVPAMVPLIGVLLKADNPLSAPMAAMATLFLVLVSLSALRARNTLVELFRTRYVQQQAEADLRLAATAFHSQEGILITDAEGEILRANAAACQMTGYAEDGLLHRLARKLTPLDREGKTFLQTMRMALVAKGFWAGECRLLTRTGSEVPIQATVTVVRDEARRPSHYVSHFQDMTEVKRAQARIEFQAYHDSLTALPNRWLLSERLEQDLARCRRHQRHGAILFADFDHFKRINDALGHRMGDAVLKTAAQRLRNHTRREDLVARFGGDEFVIVLTDLDKCAEVAKEQVGRAAAKLRELLAQPYAHGDCHLHLTASLGMVLYPADDPEADAETLLTRADTALYRAKEQGRNVQALFQADMQDYVRDRLNTETALRRALDNDEFVLVYQPQVDTDRRVVGVEALLRWRRPGRGLVPPDEFIPIAEDSGLILPIGDWVLKTACETVLQWRRSMPERALPPLAVNVSPLQFLQSDFVERVLAHLDASGIEGSSLELELTEGVLLNDVPETRNKMHQLAEHGVRFALDDFGTGYSSLRYLQQLPIMTLKIDRSFVSGLKPESGNAAIIRSVISVAQYLRLDVVAEGVETEEEVDLLIALGCRVHQGYHYTMPLENAAYLKWLEARDMAVADL